jgi:hypothetical protein
MNFNDWIFRMRTFAVCSVTFLLATGCGSPGKEVREMGADERGFVAGTGIESQDLVAVTDKMARSILQLPAIQHSTTPPVVLLEPVINNTRFPVNKELFLTRIRAQLVSKAAGKVQFVARDRLSALEQERALKQSGQVTSSSDVRTTEYKGGDYFLTGKLDGLSTRTSKGTSDYILYTFQLIDGRTSAILWEDFAEIKKQGLEDAAYR